ncbi:MAG: hypothetical protein ABFC38_06995 [Methanospirillum sp.]
MHHARWSTIVVLVTLGAFCVSLPGCMGFGYSPARDIVVLKLGGDGTQEWTRTIDRAPYDAGQDMAELAEGELVIVGQNGTSWRSPGSARVIRLLSDGKVIADRTSAGGFSRPRAVVADPDGGFTTLMQNGELTRFDRSGAAIWTCTTAMWEASSLTWLRDGGYLVGGYSPFQVWATNDSSVTGEQTIPQPVITAATWRGSTASLEDATPLDARITTLPTGARNRPTTAPTVAIPSYTPSTIEMRAQAVRYSPAGTLVWQRTYATGITAVWSAFEDPVDGTLLLAGPGPDTGRDYTVDLGMLHTDRDGVAGALVPLGQVEYHGSVQMRAVSDGIEVIASTKSAADPHPAFGVTSTILDPAGRVIAELALNASRVFNGTSDGGYVSVGVPVGSGVSGYGSEVFLGPNGYTGFHALRFDAAGTLVWDRPLSIGSIQEVKRVIQTADGGYAILAMSQ